jgi:putative transposase
MGKECWKRLYSLLLEVDECNSLLDKYGYKRKWKRRKARLYYQIQNLKNELHWKSCSYLVKNYENILLPEFAIMSMVKGKLPKKIKRLLYLFSYYQFKEKLQFKCKEYGTNIVIVDESYTSKTCTNCGNLHKTLGSNKTYNCKKCNMVIDRDVNGARNILLKTHKIKN